MDHAVNTGIGGIGAWATRRTFLSGERTASIEGHRRVTFAEFDRRTDQLAQALRGTGVRSGDRVEFVSELPRTASGKVLKTTLRKNFGGRESSVDR
jgi:acyl-coenzyme A synthetase/AMP-(fatty) acid ligase